MAVSLQFVDTSSSGVKVYATFHVTQLAEIERSREISPAHVMQETCSHSWVPLCCEKEDAVTRGLLAYEEKGFVCARSEIMVVEINFTAYGASYFLLNETLTTRGMNRYRFHGTIPFCSQSHEGQVLLQVGDIIAAPSDADSQPGL